MRSLALCGCSIATALRRSRPLLHSMIVLVGSSPLLPSPLFHVPFPKRQRWAWKLASYMSAPPTSNTACSFCCRGVDKRLVRAYGTNERARAHGQRVWERRGASVSKSMAMAAREAEERDGWEERIKCNLDAMLAMAVHATSDLRVNEKVWTCCNLKSLWTRNRLLELKFADLIKTFA
jgi:hypothetical protein